jgi:hypothetical protein
VRPRYQFNSASNFLPTPPTLRPCRPSLRSLKVSIFPLLDRHQLRFLFSSSKEFVANPQQQWSCCGGRHREQTRNRL